MKMSMCMRARLKYDTGLNRWQNKNKCLFKMYYCDKNPEKYQIKANVADDNIVIMDPEEVKAATNKQKVINLPSNPCVAHIYVSIERNASAASICVH